MEKFLLIVFGGSTAGLFAILATLAFSHGHIFQCAMVGVLGLTFLWGALMTLAEV